MSDQRKYEVKDEGEFWVNACGRRIPKNIPGYGPTKPFAGAFVSTPRTTGLPGLKPIERLPSTKKIVRDIPTVLRECGAHDGMTVSFHHHLRGGDGVLVATMKEIRKMGIKNVQLAPSSLHDGQKELIEMFKDGTVACIHTGANDSLGLSVSAGDLKGMMIVRSHGGRVRAIKEGEIKIDIAFIAAPASDDQGNCNGLLGKSACGPLGYSAIDAKLARHVVVITDNLVEYPCTPISISENYVDHVVVVPSIGDNKKIVSGTTRLSTDPQVLLIGEYCARLMDSLGLLTSELIFQAGAGGTSLTAMTALSAKLAQKKIGARMANGGTTQILVDMLKKGLVRKLTTCLSEEHQILTNKGFMFLDEVLTHPADASDPILFASYDDGRLVYESMSLLHLNDAATREMVEITCESEQHRWGHDSDPLGMSSSEKAQSNGVSMVVTPDHDIYVLRGNLKSAGNCQWSRTWEKVKAKSLVTSDERAVIKVMGAAEDGSRADASVVPTLRARLGLDSDQQVSAFVKLYFFWVGDGCLHYKSPACGDDSIAIQAKMEHAHWLKHQIQAAGLQSSEVRESQPEGDFVVFRILKPSWFRFWNAEYHLKYRCKSACTCAMPRPSSPEARVADPRHQGSKWLASWTFGLPQDLMRKGIDAYRRADGNWAVGDTSIYTACVALRDDLVRLCLHAGYSVHFTCVRPATSGTKELFQVSYSETDRTAQPILHPRRDVKRVTYTGRTWCVTLPHRYIITRRAFKAADGTITKASRPLVIGNCQAFDLVAVKSMMEDFPRHVETDIDQYANPHNSGNVCNMLDVMVAGGTEVDVDFNVNVNTHSDGSFQHNCFPTSDHEILTSLGFMTHQAVAKHFASHQTLSVACCVNGALIYAPITSKDVTHVSGNYDLVCFESVRQYLNVTPTANHRMWALTPGAGGYSCIPAEDLVKLGGSVHMQAGFVYGVSSSGTSAPFDALNLTTPEQQSAFLQLYGYWTADGYLVGKEAQVGFSPVKPQDWTFLDTLFEQLPLPRLDSRQIGAHGYFRGPDPPTGRGREFLICDTVWWEYFAGQYGHKYKGIHAETAALKAAFSRGSGVPSGRRPAIPASEVRCQLISHLTPKLGGGPRRSRAADFGALLPPNRRPPQEDVSCPRCGYVFLSPLYVSVHNQKLSLKRHLLECTGSMPSPKNPSGRQSNRSCLKPPASDLKCHHCGRLFSQKVYKAVLYQKRACATHEARCTPFAPTLPEHVIEVIPPEAEPIKSAKWFWPWVWDLTPAQARLVIKGVRFGDGDQSNGDSPGGVIYTSSVSMRDSLERLCIHAGFGTRVARRYPAGSQHGFSKQGVPIIANNDHWEVHYTDADGFLEPKVDLAEATRIPYKGDIWCVTVPTAEHLIMVRRVLERRDDGVALRTSRTLVVGNTGGHQDTAAGAKLTIITMPVARRCNPGIVDHVTSITTPGECIGAIVTEEGVAINPRRRDLLSKLEGKTEAELGFKLVSIEYLRQRGIEKAGRRHTQPRTLDRIIGVIEWRDGTVLDIVRQPLNRKGMGINNARVDIKFGPAPAPNSVKVTCIEDAPYITPEAVQAMTVEMLAALGIAADAGLQLEICYDYAKDFIVAASIEVALKRTLKDKIPKAAAYHTHAPLRTYPPPQRDRPLRRSHLYIPGVDGYMVAKGGTSGADGVILDLEDSVDPAQKDYARIIVRHALRHAVDFGDVEKMIRINGVGEAGFTDIEEILPHAPVDVVVVPKVESAADVRAVEKKICEVLHVERSPVLLVCLIESALGVENAHEIVHASPNIIGISMGLEDYTADRGIERTETDDESQWALQRVSNAAATAGGAIQMIDVVYSTLDDTEGIEKAIARAKKMGMFGKRCIHPNQVPVVNRCFSPEKPDIDESTTALMAFLKADASVGVVKITGKKGKPKMVDKPVLIRAARCIKLAMAVGLLPNDPWTKNLEDLAKRLGL